MLSNPQYQTPRGRREAYDVFKPELERALSKKTVAEWCGKETRPFAPFVQYTNDHFTKTGSGQTQGKLKTGRVSAGLLQARGVPCGAVADLQEAVDNVQLQHRNMYPTTADGTFVIGNSIRLSNYPQQPVQPYVAARGEHTELVLGQLAQPGSKL
jgi:crotonobetainyl-CoA:carnitine CoA-transferase CaiB-like acyl-CoA transferase